MGRAGALRGTFGLFDGPWTTVRIQFSPKVARYVTRKQWMPTQVVEEHADGRVILTMTARGTTDVVSWVRLRRARRGARAGSLRDELAAVTKTMAAAYQPAPVT